LIPATLKISLLFSLRIQSLSEKNQEDLDHRELDMAVRYVRFISVREELAGKSILSYQSLRIRIIVRNQGSLYNAGKE